MSGEATTEFIVDGLADRERLDWFVTEGYLRAQRHPEADLWIYNYTEKTQYENHWTPETITCRGLIVDASGNIEARPFCKFFNYGAPGGDPLDLPYYVAEKYDGSLGILYWIEGDPHIASRGSFTSDQAKVGTELIQRIDVAQVQTDRTELFEIIFPENRIVVDYGDRRDLIHLATINNATGRDLPLTHLGFECAERHGSADLDQLAALEESNREGFVVVYESGHRIKVKLAEYVRLHKIVTGVNARMIWESLRDGDDLDALIKDIPDEIFAWIEGQRQEIVSNYTTIERACHIAFDARPLTDDRKTLAVYFQQSGANPSVLFRMLDDRPYADLIWKAIKPKPLTPVGPPLNAATNQDSEDSA